LYWADWNIRRPAIYRSSVVNPAPVLLVADNMKGVQALAVDFTGKQAASIHYISCITLKNYIYILRAYSGICFKSR